MIAIIFTGLFAAVLYFGQMYHHRRHWEENFQVDVAFSEDQAGEGDTLYLYETAVNNKKMKLPVICVKFQASRYLDFEDMEGGAVSDNFYRNDVMSVDSYQKVRRKLRFVCRKRGLYRIEEAELVSYDLFCSHTFARKKKVDASLCVYPSMVDVRRFLPLFRQMNGGMPTGVPLFEDPYAFAGVREYTPRDSMRKIHWKASARMGSWQVKTSEYHAAAPVVILLNLESPGVFTNRELMEESIRIAYSLVFYFSERGITTRLVANGDEKVCLRGTGRTQVAALRHALARVSYDKPGSGEELLRAESEKLRQAEHVILISAAGKKPFQELALEIMRHNPLSWVRPVTPEGEDEFREVPARLDACIVKWRCVG